MAGSGGNSAHAECPQCQSKGPFEYVDDVTSVVCSCGHLFQDSAIVLTNDWRYDPGAVFSGPHQDNIASWSSGILALKKSGAVSGPEASKISREQHDRAQAADHHALLRRALSRLTGLQAGTHPLEHRIRQLFDSLRRATTKEDDASLSESPAPHKSQTKFRWGRIAQAALAACIYAVFRENDGLLAHRDPLESNCYSLQLVASCVGIVFGQCKKWVKSLTQVMPQRFADLRADEPVVHVDQVVKWLREQIQANVKSVLFQQHLSILRKLDDAQWTSIRSLARSICTSLLAQDQELRDAISAKKYRVCPGEWGYYAVLWAIGHATGQRLLGKVWVKPEIVHLSLGGAALDDDDAISEESDSDGSSDGPEATVGAAQRDDFLWRHILMYQDIGRAVAERALQLPWVSKASVRKVRNGRTALKDGEEVKYVKDVVDFASGIAANSSEQQRAAKQVSLPASNQDQSESPNEGSVSPPPLAPKPSFTAIHHPRLADDPTLLDVLDDATIDALLFNPGEMDSYLRTDELERRALQQRKLETGEWVEDEPAMEFSEQSTTRPVAGPGNSNPLKRGRPKSAVSLQEDENLATVSSRGKTRRTKVNERLLAAVREAEAMPWGVQRHSAGTTDQWSDDEEEGGGLV
ncbi:unnamed protein product [Jaminaea pallidilutea]